MSSTYNPTIPPQQLDRIPEYLYDELLQISSILRNVQEGREHPVLYVAPGKPREGMIAVADGVEWNPGGTGPGHYEFIGGKWRKLNGFAYRLMDFYSIVDTSSHLPYFHIKTDIDPSVVDQTYSVRFQGHDYQAPKPIDAGLVFYSYTTSNAPVNIGSEGSHNCSAYKSADNKIVLTIQMVGTYYTSFTLSLYPTTQGIRPFKVLAWSTSSNPTGVY